MRPDCLYSNVQCIITAATKPTGVNEQKQIELTGVKEEEVKAISYLIYVHNDSVIKKKVLSPSLIFK